MANTILHKRSSTTNSVPTSGQMTLGELALNTTDGRIYMKTPTGVVEVSYRDSRARSAISTSGTGITYDSATGVLSSSATSANTASAVVSRDSSGNFSAGTITAALSGNASTATELQNARTINGTSFDGTANVTVTAASSTLTGTTLASNVTGSSLTSVGTLVNLTVTNTITGSVSGNAGTATKLATARTISGTSFDGSANITLTTAGITEATNLYYTDVRVKDYLSGGTLNGDIIPATDNVYSLGSASKMWKDVYVGPGSLYVNGQKVLEESSGNIVVSADINQNLVLATTGDGNLELDPQGTGSILLKGPVQVQAGSSVISSDGNAIQFGNQVAVDSITSKSSNTDLTLTAAGTGKVLINDSLTVANNLIVSGNLTINGTTTTINATTLSIADNIVDLNSNVTGAPTTNAGIRVVRGDESATQLRWNETTDAWQYTADGSAYFDIVGATATQTLTNKTIAANSNTISGLTNANFNGTAGITNANLANSTVTVGSTAITLGSTATSIAGLTSVTASTFTGNLVGNVTGNVTGTVTGGISGNAATATALQNARTINGVSFDGTGNVTVITAGTGVTINGTQISVDTSTTLDKTTAQTLSNKTLASPVITGTATFNGSTSGSIAVQATATAGTNTITLPAVTGTVVTTGDTGSVTNAMLAGSIADSKLSTISTAGKVSNSATTAASANTASAIVARDASGNFTAGTITAALTGNVTGNVTGTVSGNAGTVTNGIYSTDTGTVTNTMLAGSIADSKLSTISTAGKVSNSATTAASANTASAIVARDASGNFTAGTITAALTGNVTGNTTGTHTGAVVGNASTATTLATARTISGTSFDGSANITLTTAGITEATNLYFTDARAVSANASAIATAKSEAISTAASDATSKANAAQAAAIAAVTNGAGAAYDTLREIQDLMATDAELSSAIAAISNVPSATKLQTARTIQGVSFDGTAAITVVTAGTGISVSGTAVTNTGILSISGTAPVSASTTSGATTISMAAATASVNGYMTSTYAAKLDGIAAGATNVTNTNQLTNGAGYYSSGSTPSFGATSTGALSVTGAITATGDMTAYYSSDRNLKTNIAPITGALAKVEAISGVTYNWNETAVEQGKSADVREAGVIAQEVQAVLPEVVKTRDNGFLAVDYEKMVALLIEAVKELSAEVKDLKAQLNK